MREARECRALSLLSLSLLSLASFSSSADPTPFPPLAPRLDCAPDLVKPTAEACASRACIWQDIKIEDPIGMPACFMNASAIGYVGKRVSTSSGLPANYSLERITTVSVAYWSTHFDKLTLQASDVGNGVINVRIAPDDKRFDVQDVISLPKETLQATARLDFEPHAPDAAPFSFAIRRSDGTRVFDTAIGGFVFAEQFIQIATTLPSSNMYGVGENVHPTLKHDFSSYTTWAMFARDEPPNSAFKDTKGLYGVHPFYMILENDGRAHGVLFLNSNAQELTTLPGPSVLYRTIGGLVDLFFFPGPSPGDVTRQYLAFIGRPTLPPFWALGFQLCRYGYKDLNEMKARVAAVRAAGIPFDIAYADIDYMQRYKDFTIGEKEWDSFEKYIDQLHKWNMRSILIWDPAIQVDYASFQRAVEQNASFISWPSSEAVQKDINDLYPLTKDTSIMLGVVWPDAHVAFPDFLENNTNSWWKSEFSRFHKQIKFDGAWIDMNEPAVFGTNEEHPWYFDDEDHPNIAPLRCPLTNQWNKPPFETHQVYLFRQNNETLTTKTLCMDAVTAAWQRLYDVKNLYGWAETKATAAALEAATGKRGVVISRSTFVSSGHYAGHWLGDNTATWRDLRSAVIGVMEFNLFGIPYVGSDVCGFGGASNEQLCARWQQLGSFHSFYRNHNAKGEPSQDPAVWPLVANVTRKANTFRYAYLPYLYTLHFRASLLGDTVIHPVFFDFPRDEATRDLGEQFMWGAAVMVAPVLHENASSVSAYIPGDDFFSLYDHEYAQPVKRGLSDFPAPLVYNAPTFVRGGSIIPRQAPAVTTKASRANPLNLLIVPVSSNASASGELFWDDGESIVRGGVLSSADYYRASFSYSFSASSNTSTLVISTERNFLISFVKIPPVAHLEIFNMPLPANRSSFMLNKKTSLRVFADTSSYDEKTRLLRISLLDPIVISGKGEQTLTWQHAPEEKKDAAASTLCSSLVLFFISSALFFF